MKRTITVLLALTAVVLSSCSVTEKTDKTEATSNEKYKMSDLEDGAYYLGEDTLAVFPYADKFYKVGDELGYYDISADMAYTKLCDIDDAKEANIYVDDSGIYYFDGSNLSQIGFDGTTRAEYVLNDGDVRYFQVQVCVLEDYIIACSVRRTESEASTFDLYIYTVERSTEEVTEYFIGQSPALDTILMLEPGDKPNMAVMLKSYYPDGVYITGAENVYAVYTFDAEKGKLTEEYDYDFDVGGADYIADDNRLYAFLPNTYLNASGSFRLASADFDAEDFTGYRNISGETAFRPIKNAVTAGGNEVNMMSFILHPYHFFTGYDYICLDEYNNTVCVFSGTPDSSGQSLTILYPTEPSGSDTETTGNNLDNAVIRPNIEFEEANNVSVKTQSYAIDEFADRLRMKLLANDTDYDIVYLDNAGELLPHILRYGLYLPLEEYSEITSSFDNYIDGVRDVMSYDGHIYGVPYTLGGLSFTVQEEYHTLGFPALEGTYSFDDFWDICEKVKTDCNGEALTIDFHLFRELLKAVIEDGAEKGKINESAVYDTVSKFMEYHDAGVITPWNNGSFLLGHIYTFSNIGIRMTDYRPTFRELIPYPSYNGKNYVSVESIIYANSLTENTELSVKYLSMLMTKDYAAEAVSGKSNLWKEKDDYFVSGNYGTNTAALVEAEYEIPGKQYSFSEYDIYLIDNGSTALENAAPSLYSEAMDEFLYSVFDELTAGELTIEEAADKIFKEAKYRIME